MRTPDAARRARARSSRRRTASRSHKLKGGVFPPDYELECYRALAAAFPGRPAPLRPERARCRVAEGHPLRPGDRGPEQRLPRGPGLGARTGMRRVREPVRVPLGDEHRRRQLRAARRQRAATAAVDVVLLDTTFWGGIRPVRQGGRGVRDLPARASPCTPPASWASSWRPCCISARSCPTSPTPPTPTTTSSRDDVIEGGKLRLRDGAHRGADRAGARASGSTATRSPATPSSTSELGGYPYDRDPGRPGWYAAGAERPLGRPGGRTVPDRVTRSGANSPDRGR